MGRPDGGRRRPADAPSAPAVAQAVALAGPARTWTGAGSRRARPGRGAAGAGAALPMPAVPVGAAPSLSGTGPVQQATGSTSASSSLVVTLPANVTSGNALVAFVSATTSTFFVSTVTGGGVSWTRITFFSDGANVTPEAWHGVNSSGGSATVTCTLSSSLSAVAHVSEWAGFDLQATPLFETYARASGTSLTAGAGTLTTTTSGDLLLAASGISTAGAIGSVSAGFADLLAPSPIATLHQVVAYRANAAPGSHAPSWLLAGPASWAGVAVAFKMLAVTPTPTPTSTPTATPTPTE